VKLLTVLFDEQNALLDLLGGMDPGEHDIVTDAPSATSNSIFGDGGLGELAGISSLTIAPNSGTSSTSILPSDIFDFLGGVGSSNNSNPLEVGTDNHAGSLDSSFHQQPDLTSLSMASAFPSISNMPLFATVPSTAVNGMSPVQQQHELIPGQFFPSSFFSLSKPEQLSKLREKADQDSIMSGELKLIIQLLFLRQDVI